MLRLVPALAFGVGVAMTATTARAATGEERDILCAEQLESALDLDPPEALLELDNGDCAPAELLPDVECEDPPSTFWPAAVNACDTPLVKIRGGALHRAQRLIAASGRRPLKDVAASDLGSFRSGASDPLPLPDQDLRVARDPTLAAATVAMNVPVARLPFDRGSAAPIPAGHARRLDRPPEA